MTDQGAQFENKSGAGGTFVQLVTEHQVRLRGFLLASLGDFSIAEEVLQRTNLVLWKKAGEFREGAEFLPWALAVARFEVQGFLRDRGRDRHIFDSDVCDLMTDSGAAMVVTTSPDRHSALRHCVDGLPHDRRQLLEWRYAENWSIQRISEAT